MCKHHLTCESFHATALCPFSLKTWEYQTFSDVLGGHMKIPVTWNWLTTWKTLNRKYLRQCSINTNNLLIRIAFKNMTSLSLIFIDFIYRNQHRLQSWGILPFRYQKDVINSCYRTVPSAIWEIFSEFLIFCKIVAKYEKREKYLPILHEAACDNYFIAKCLLKSNVARVILFAY